jgi:hypothetical protein
MTEERDTAKRIVELLEWGTTEMDAGTQAKLAGAREQAMAAMGQQVHVAPAGMAHAGFGHYVTSHLHGRNAWMTGMAAVAIVLMLLALSHHNATWEPVQADALLLGSDLPPEAYLDKGFDAWLENSSQP